MFDLNINRPNVSGSAQIAGGKFVWVKSAHREVLMNGVKLINAPKYGEVYYAGDAVLSILKGQTVSSYTATENVGWVFKGYKLAKALTSTDTTVYVLKDDRSHVLVSGLDLYNSTDHVVVGAVTETTVTVGTASVPVYSFNITANALGTASAGDILVDKSNLPVSLTGTLHANSMLCNDIYNAYDPKNYTASNWKSEVFIECKAYKERLSYASAAEFTGNGALATENVKGIIHLG